MMQQIELDRWVTIWCFIAAISCVLLFGAVFIDRLFGPDTARLLQKVQYLLYVAPALEVLGIFFLVKAMPKTLLLYGMGLGFAMYFVFLLSLFASAQLRIKLGLPI